MTKHILLRRVADEVNDLYTIESPPDDVPKVAVIGPGIRPGMPKALREAIQTRMFASLLGKCPGCDATWDISVLQPGVSIPKEAQMVHEADCVATDESLTRLYRRFQSGPAPN